METNNYLVVLDQLLGVLLIVFGVIFFMYARKNNKWGGFETYIAGRRYSVVFVSIFLGTLLLFGYAKIFRHLN